jgi:hypothetical protein
VLKFRNKFGRLTVKGMMAEKGLQEEDWTDRNSWKKKIA